MWNGVVTNLGLSLLEQWAAGSETLYIDKATAGSGTVAQSNMRGSTYVQGEVGDVSIVASIPVTGGTQYRIQVSANPDAAYIMHQIGIWAHLGASGGTTLLALYQDEDGVSVPLEADDPGFGFTLYAVVSMSNQGSVSVNFDGGAYVTRDDFSSALAGYAKTVNGNGPNSDGNVTLPTDTTPTQNSTNYVTSGGVYTGLASKAPVVTLADGTDLDTVKTAGLYYIGANGVNLPNSAVNGYILVISNTAGTRAKQLFMRHGTQNSNDFQTYVRQYNGSTWGDWVKVLTAGQAVQITEGGTGATTAAAALENLGIGGLAGWTDVFTTLSDLITFVSGAAQYSRVIVRVSVDVLTALTNGTTTLGGIAIILRASANNGYYFAFNRDTMGYGNINFSTGAVSILHQVEDNVYQPGDTFSTSYTINMPGTLSNNTKTILLTVVVPKSLQNISTITVNSLKGGIRSYFGGYLGSGNADSPWVTAASFEVVGASGTTMTATKASDNTVLIRIDSTTVYTEGATTTAMTNNVALTLLGSVTMTFS